MWVVLKQSDLVVWGRIVEIKPDRLAVAPTEPATMKRGSEVSMAGLAFGQVPTVVVGSRDGKIVLRRPAAVQLWFRTRRSHRRLPLEVPVTLEREGWPPLSGMTEDVSLGGALLLVPGGPELISSGEPARLTLALSDGTITVNCAVRFSSDSSNLRHFGVQFTVVQPQDRQLLVTCLEELLADFRTGPS